MVSASSTGTRLNRDLNRRLSEVVVTLARLVITGDEPADLAHETVLAVATALDADRCEILRPAPGRKRLLRVASCGEDAVRGGQDTLPCGVSSIAGYALLCEAPVFSTNLEKEKRFGPVGAPSGSGPVSAVAAPLSWCEDRGVLVAYAARYEAFDSGHALSVGRVASLFGDALQRLREHRDLVFRAEETERCSRPSAGTVENPAERANLALTGRQLEVLNLIADGRSAKQMASALDLSIHTVHTHQRNLYRALGVGSSAGALKQARELGLLEPVDPTLGNG